MRIKYALGLIEAIGLATAYEAADAAMKSANVELLGFEPARGDGMHTIKVIGDVGAVKAAVAAAEVAGSKGRGVFSSVVIARPAEGIMPLINNKNNITKESRQKERLAKQAARQEQEEVQNQTEDVTDELAEEVSEEIMDIPEQDDAENQTEEVTDELADEVSDEVMDIPEPEDDA